MHHEELPVEGVGFVGLGEDTELLRTIRSENDIPDPEVILVRITGHDYPSFGLSFLVLDADPNLEPKHENHLDRVIVAFLIVGFKAHRVKEDPRNGWREVEEVLSL